VLTDARGLTTLTLCCAGFGLAVGSGLPRRAEAEPAKSDQALRNGLADVLKDWPGRYSVSVRPADGTEVAELAGGTPLPLASVYKVPIAYALFAAAQRGELDINQEVSVSGEDAIPGVGPLAPGDYSLLKLAELMVARSDNVATDKVLCLVPPRQVTAEMGKLGLRSLRVDRTTRQMIYDFFGFQPSPEQTGPVSAEQFLAAVSRQGIENERTAARTAFLASPLDTGSASDLTALLMMIHAGRPSREAADQILAFMERAGRGLLGRNLPADVRVAAKVGRIGAVRSEAALIYLPSGEPVAVAAMLVGDARTDADPESRISRIGRAVYDCMGQCSPPGRAP